MESYNCYAIFLINIKMNSRRTKIAPSQRELANAIRALSMDAVEQAKSGHPGMPMGTVSYTHLTLPTILLV